MKRVLLVSGFLILLFAPFFGEIKLTPSSLWDAHSLEHQVFFQIRLPRVLLAFFVGGILSLGGMVFQVVFRNPMSTPFTLGVASGATLFTAAAIVMGFSFLSPLFAFTGAVLTILILFGVASRFKGYDPTSLLLVGIALSFFYAAALMLMFYLSSLQESYEIMRFTMGNLDVVGYRNILLLACTSLLLIWLVIVYRMPLRALLTSYEFAFMQGIHVRRVSYILLLGVSLAVGVAVSLTGPIGFVGLIIPHILLRIYRQSTDRIIMPVFFYGGVFLVLSDLIARNLGNTDLPIGVVTSFLGAPFFIYILLKRNTA